MTRMPLGAFALLALLARAATAQGDCFPPAASNEARTMAIFDVPLAFSGAAAPIRRQAGEITAGIEVTYLPKVSDSLATPKLCRPNKGPEHTDFLFAVPRPRIALGLPAGFALEASWIPPLRISDVRANLVGVALSRVTALNARGAVLGVRAHGSYGVIKAPITCDDAALQDASSECFMGTRSDDAFKPGVLGVEAAVAWPLGRMIRPYIGAGYNHLAPRFQVNFTNSQGSTDRRKVTVDLDRVALFAGATWQATRIVELSGEIYSAPTDAVTGRVTGRLRLR
jgi:hypothetical protein